MRPSELPKHKQHEARRERLKWWGRNGAKVHYLTAWILLVILGFMILLKDQVIGMISNVL